MCRARASTSRRLLKRLDRVAKIAGSPQSADHRGLSIDRGFRAKRWPDGFFGPDRLPRRISSCCAIRSTSGRTRSSAPETKQTGRTILIITRYGRRLGRMHGIAAATDRLREEKPDDVVLVAPVAAEIRFELDQLPRSRRQKLLEAEYPAEARCAGRTGRNRSGRVWSPEGPLAAPGQPIEDFDIAIGSIAVMLDARLATLNAKAGAPRPDRRGREYDRRGGCQCVTEPGSSEG